MGSSSENFCLRWNDFESNISCAFDELRAESDFFDVTLACDDNNGKTLRAHKVILSACSSFSDSSSSVPSPSAIAAAAAVAKRPRLTATNNGQNLVNVKNEPVGFDVSGPSTSGTSRLSNPAATASSSVAAPMYEEGSGAEDETYEEEEEEDDDGFVYEEDEGSEMVAEGMEDQDGTKDFDYVSRYGGVIRQPSGHGQCLQCGRVFKSVAVGRRHYDAAHCKQVACRCYICQKSYKNELSLKEHLRAIHKIFQKNLPANL